MKTCETLNITFSHIAITVWVNICCHNNHSLSIIKPSLVPPTTCQHRTDPLVITYKIVQKIVLKIVFACFGRIPLTKNLRKHCFRHSLLKVFKLELLLLGGCQNSLKSFKPDLDRNKLGLNLVQLQNKIKFIRGVRTPRIKFRPE